MSILIFIKFMYGLSITGDQRQQLTYCTLYGKKANTERVVIDLCACSAKLNINSVKLKGLCNGK